MNRIYKGLLSSIISLMMLITTALIPGFLNFSVASAQGVFEDVEVQINIGGDQNLIAGNPTNGWIKDVNGDDKFATITHPDGTAIIEITDWNITGGGGSTVFVKVYGIGATLMNISAMVASQSQGQGGESYENIPLVEGQIIEINVGNKLNFLKFTMDIYIDYTLSYVTNVDGLFYDDVMFNQGDDITPPIPSYDNHTFLGWFEEDMETEFDFSSMPARDVTVYAQWEAIDYTFTFDPNFGEEANVVQEFIAGGNVDGTTFMRMGYIFVGWTLDEEGFNAYEGGLTNLPGEDIYVYAQWEAVDYTFTFDPNWGVEVNVEETFNVGGSVEAAMFTRVGFSFIGWTLDEEGLITYEGGLSNLPAEDVYVYAQWEASEFTFTFDPNFGDEMNVIQAFNVGGSVAGTTFIRIGFMFDGWTLDEEGLIAYEGGLTNLPAQNIYVYAQWEELPENEFVLTYVTNQPGLTIPSVVFIEGETIVAPMPVAEGFEFLGWYSDEGLLVLFDQFDSMPAENVTVYADWGVVLGEEEEFEEEEETLIPDMSDETRTIHLGLFFAILGMLTIIASKKEKYLV